MCIFEKLLLNKFTTGNLKKMLLRPNNYWKFEKYLRGEQETWTKHFSNNYPRYLLLSKINETLWCKMVHYLFGDWATIY